jgi:hypothetical protein
LRPSRETRKGPAVSVKVEDIVARCTSDIERVGLLRITFRIENNRALAVTIEDYH